MKPYNCFRSSASSRVRIALESKGLAYKSIAIQLTRGQHRKEPYAAPCANTLGRARVRALAQPSACADSQA